eukprot:jgi/Tetstr1/450347/TSEL_037383.t1
MAVIEDKFCREANTVARPFKKVDSDPSLKSANAAAYARRRRPERNSRPPKARPMRRLKSITELLEIKAQEILEEIEHLPLDREIECANRLIKYDELWFEHKCTRDTQALQLSTREMGWIAAKHIGPHTNALQILSNLVFSSPCPTLRLQWLGQRRPDRQRGIERPQWILKDHLDVARKTAPIAPMQPSKRNPIKKNAP